MTLRPKILLGVRWGAISQIGEQLISLSSLLVFMYYLPPAAFGRFGLSSLLPNLYYLCAGLGTGTALIKEREPSDRLLSSVFWLSLGIGLLSAGIIFVLAYPLSLFLGDLELCRFLYLLCLICVFHSLGLVSESRLRSELKFQKLSVIRLFSCILGAAVAMCLLGTGQGELTLIVQILVTSITQNLFHLWYAKWYPKFIFSRSELGEIIPFATNLTTFKVWDYLSRNIDDLLVAKFLGVEALGFYSLAYKLVYLPISLFSSTVENSLYIVFSQHKLELRELHQSYLRASEGVAFICFPLMIGLAVLAEPVISHYFDSKWMPLIPLILIFAPTGMFQSIGCLQGVIFKMYDELTYLSRWGFCCFTLVTLGIIRSLSWGIFAVAFTYSLTSLICLMFLMQKGLRLLQSPAITLLSSLVPSFGCSLFMGGLVYLLHRCINLYPPLLVMFGAGAYFLISYKYNSRQFINARAVLMQSQ